MNPHGTGAHKSPLDIRTFAYQPAMGKLSGGKRYSPDDIEDQYVVGICTAISLTQNARKATGMPYSADFQYLLQKTEYDKNWDEGSSLSSSLKVAKNFGLLPATFFREILPDDRKLPYEAYVAKLKAIPKERIDELKAIAAGYKIKAYTKVPIDRDSLANAISESTSGVLVRFAIGSEWWRPPIEPLRKPQTLVSGHATIQSNYDGDSFRIANTWGSDWADEGTAYHLLSSYAPTEAWLVYYNEVPEHVADQLAHRETLMAKVIDLLQQLLGLLQKAKGFAWHKPQ